MEIVVKGAGYRDTDGNQFIQGSRGRAPCCASANRKPTASHTLAPCHINSFITTTSFSNHIRDRGRKELRISVTKGASPALQEPWGGSNRWQQRCWCPCWRGERIESKLFEFLFYIKDLNLGYVGTSLLTILAVTPCTCPGWRVYTIPWAFVSPHHSPER